MTDPLSSALRSAYGSEVPLSWDLTIMTYAIISLTTAIARTT
jgi:hypothetical protein